MGFIATVLEFSGGFVAVYKGWLTKVPCGPVVSVLW